MSYRRRPHAEIKPAELKPLREWWRSLRKRAWLNQCFYFFLLRNFCVHIPNSLDGKGVCDVDVSCAFGHTECKNLSKQKRLTTLCFASKANHKKGLDTSWYVILEPQSKRIAYYANCPKPSSCFGYSWQIQATSTTLKTRLCNSIIKQYATGSCFGHGLASLRLLEN